MILSMQRPPSDTTISALLGSIRAFHAWVQGPNIWPVGPGLWPIPSAIGVISCSLVCAETRPVLSLERERQDESNASGRASASCFNSEFVRDYVCVRAFLRSDWNAYSCRATLQSLCFSLRGR